MRCASMNCFWPTAVEVSHADRKHRGLLLRFEQFEQQFQEFQYSAEFIVAQFYWFDDPRFR